MTGSETTLRSATTIERIMLLGLMAAILFICFLDRQDFKNSMARAEARIQYLQNQHEGTMLYAWYSANEIDKWLKDRWAKQHTGNPKEGGKK